MRDRQLSEGSGRGLGEKGEGINPKSSRRHRCVGMTRGKGVREVGEGKGGEMVMEGHSTWGAEHTIQYTDDVL